MPKNREPDASEVLEEPIDGFSPKELATVLAALRRWQEVLDGDESVAEMVHFDEHDPLTADEIDGLCERLNLRTKPDDASTASESTVPPATPRNYNVHCYAVVRCLVKGVEAESPQAAVEKAWERISPDLQQRFTTDEGEFADEFSHFLVDVVDDESFRQSQWFHSAEQPLLAYLNRLIYWADQSGALIPADLRKIVDDVREELVAVV